MGTRPYPTPWPIEPRRRIMSEMAITSRNALITLKYWSAIDLNKNAPYEILHFRPADGGRPAGYVAVSLAEELAGDHDHPFRRPFDCPFAVRRIGDEGVVDPLPSGCGVRFWPCAGDWVRELQHEADATKENQSGV
jgi:hypothetical protein